MLVFHYSSSNFIFLNVVGVVADINTFQDSQNNTYFIGLSYKQFYVIIEAYIIIIIIIILYDEETFFFSFLIAITSHVKVKAKAMMLSFSSSRFSFLIVTNSSAMV